MPTKTEKQWMGRVAELGCIVCKNTLSIYSPAEIHHATTGAGGRRNHLQVLPLCFVHHRGHKGVATLGRKKWQSIYGTEQDLLAQVELLLQESDF